MNGYVSIALSLQIGVLLIRLLGTIAYNNYALLFESFHILTDILVTVVVFAAIKLSNSKYSRRYSYGLFKIEDLISLAIAAIIAFTAIDLLLSLPPSNVSVHLQSGVLQLISVIPLFLSGIVKVIGGRRVNSPSLVSDGFHNYSDVYVGLGVGIGLIASYATRIGFFYYLAISIAAIGIFYTAVKIGRDSIIGIMDLPKDKKVVPKIEKIARESTQVTGVKSIKARWAGPVIFVEIVLSVNSKLTIEEAHDVADLIEKRVLAEVPGVRDVVIHIEPSRSLERVVILPTSEPGKIDRRTSKSRNYLIVKIREGKTVDSASVPVPTEEIAPERNAQRVLELAKQNMVTDAVVLNAGEILYSLLTVNHIYVWRARSDSVDENIKLLMLDQLNRFLPD